MTRDYGILRYEGDTEEDTTSSRTECSYSNYTITLIMTQLLKLYNNIDHDSITQTIQ
jgi:hypothetical protein